ncbi:MAG: hypothetical protein QXJ27_02990, partial [Thermoplasmata archaeon]
FHENYIEFLEELAYRFYQVTSERRLALITEKPKDRYYRLLDPIYTNHWCLLYHGNPGRIWKWNSVIELEKRVLGRFIVVTNIKEESYEDIIENYKGLQKIEEGFRVLKSEFFLRPVYHWTERRVIAHILWVGSE